ncbi:DUF5979 domain-containing protein, partial [Actinomyces howellii]
MRTPSPSARSERQKSFRAVVVAVLAALVAAVGVIAPGIAAMNAGIAITIPELLKSDANGVTSAGYIAVGDVAKVQFTWDARGTTLADGDSFTIELGSNFEAREVRTIPVTVVHNGAQVTIGTCQITKTAITCTMNSEVERLRVEGFTDFRGTGETLLIATAATTAETTTMTVNGATTAVDLPGTGGIRAAPLPTYRPANFTKVSTPLSAASKGVPWSIGFGTENLAATVPGFVADGVTTSTLTFTDTIGAGQTFDTNLANWSFSHVSSATSTTRSVLLNAAGRVYNSPGEDFTYTVTFNESRTVATMTLTGVFQPKTNYSLSSPNTINAGNAQEGVVYRNSVTIDGTSLTANGERYYNDTSKVTAALDPGYGGFEVTKYVDGTGVDHVPAGTTFDVVVSYTLPQDASTYPTWTPPGTLNADGRTGTVVLKVSNGKISVFPGSFPQGTVLSLSEDPTSASVEFPDAYSWGTPVFKVGNQVRNTLTIGDRTSQAVSLTNSVSTETAVLAVSKTMTGLEAGATAPTYSFTYACGSVTGTISNVPADGTPVAATPRVPLLAGATCTVTENVEGTAVEGYDLTSPSPVTVELQPAANGTTVAAVTNTYTRQTGSFSVSKVVAGDGSFGADEFLVHYECEVPGAAAVSGDLTVAGGGSVDGPVLPVGSVCAVSEPASSAQRAGFGVETSVSVDGQVGSEVTVVKDTTAAVVVTNTYTRQTGSLEISKVVDGDGAGVVAGREYTFTYVCQALDGSSPSGTVTVAAGSSGSVADLPVGRCVVTEGDAVADGTDVVTTWRVGGQEVTGEVGVDIADGAVASVEVTNTYTRQTGSFSVSKVVAGDGSFGADEFLVHYECEVPGAAAVSGDLTVAGGGSVDGPVLPVGSVCAVSEPASSAQRAGFGVETSVSVDGQVGSEVTVVKDTTAAVVVTNTYT